MGTVGQATIVCSRMWAMYLKYCWVKKMGSRGRWSESGFSQPTRRQCQSAFKKQGGRSDQKVGQAGYKSYVANHTQQRACLCLCVCRCDDAWQ